jgi:hypothetical protein
LACVSSAVGELGEGETFMKTPVVPCAAALIASVSENVPGNKIAPAALREREAGEMGSRTSAWTECPVESRAVATAPPWWPVAPVMKKAGILKEELEFLG